MANGNTVIPHYITVHVSLPQYITDFSVFNVSWFMFRSLSTSRIFPSIRDLHIIHMSVCYFINIHIIFACLKLLFSDVLMIPYAFIGLLYTRMLKMRGVTLLCGFSLITAGSGPYHRRISQGGWGAAAPPV